MVTLNELVYDIYVKGIYRRTFSNEIQINEFCKRIWNKDCMAKVTIKPVLREYVNEK